VKSNAGEGSMPRLLYLADEIKQYSNENVKPNTLALTASNIGQDSLTQL
jgi:hypothetical protein